MAEQPPPPPTSETKQVPEELLGELHDANARFHEDKEQVEAAMDDTEFRHQDRVNQATEELRRAERRVEEVESEIAKKLDKPG